MKTKILNWISKNFSQIYDKDCYCCRSNNKKFHKLIKYLNKTKNGE